MQEVFNVIKRGDFSLGDETAHANFCGLVDKLCNITEAGTWNGDKYLLIHDFPSYVDAQSRVDATYADKAKWCSLSIQAASCMAKFSTDRTMQEYSDVIWGVKPAPRQMPKQNSKSALEATNKKPMDEKVAKETSAKKAAENKAAKEEKAEPVEISKMGETVLKEATGKQVVAKKAAEEPTAVTAALETAKKEATETTPEIIGNA
jgi:hypothetical protein